MARQVFAHPGQLGGAAAQHKLQLLGEQEIAVDGVGHIHPDATVQVLGSGHHPVRRIAGPPLGSPDFGLVMPPWADPYGRSPDACLRHAAYAGARNRYGEELGEAVVQRLEHELSVIAGMGFSAYFLVVKDIVSQSPRTCGRGSAAASLVAYCLNITNVCPVKHNLYFGRFLNPGRTDPPDIDVDFVARSLKEFHELIFKKISKIDGVISTETSLMVDLVKDEYAWGTAWD